MERIELGPNEVLYKLSEKEKYEEAMILIEQRERAEAIGRCLRKP